MGVWAVSVILNLVAVIFKNNETLITVAAIVAQISGIFSIVATFMYIGLLNKARKMLAK